MDERRRNARIVYHRPVKLTLDGGRTVASWSRDFSMQGIAVVAPQRLTVGQSVHVQLDLNTRELRHPIRLIGTVVYSRDHGNDYVSGIEFR